MVEHGIADPMVAGSIPVTPFLYFILYTQILNEAMAQRLTRRIPDPKIGGSNPSSLKLFFFLSCNKYTNIPMTDKRLVYSIQNPSFLLNLASNCSKYSFLVVKTQLFG